MEDIVAGIKLLKNSHYIKHLSNFKITLVRCQKIKGFPGNFLKHISKGFTEYKSIPGFSRLLALYYIL